MVGTDVRINSLEGSCVGCWWPKGDGCALLRLSKARVSEGWIEDAGLRRGAMLEKATVRPALPV